MWWENRRGHSVVKLCNPCGSWVEISVRCGWDAGFGYRLLTTTVRSQWQKLVSFPVLAWTRYCSWRICSLDSWCRMDSRCLVWPTRSLSTARSTFSLPVYTSVTMTQTRRRIGGAFRAQMHKMMPVQHVFASATCTWTSSAITVRFPPLDQTCPKA